MHRALLAGRERHLVGGTAEPRFGDSQNRSLQGAREGHGNVPTAPPRCPGSPPAPSRTNPPGKERRGSPVPGAASSSRRGKARGRVTKETRGAHCDTGPSRCHGAVVTQGRLVLAPGPVWRCGSGLSEEHAGPCPAAAQGTALRRLQLPGIAARGCPWRRASSALSRPRATC